MRAACLASAPAPPGGGEDSFVKLSPEHFQLVAERLQERLQDQSSKSDHLEENFSSLLEQGNMPAVKRLLAVIAEAALRAGSAHCALAAALAFGRLPARTAAQRDEAARLRLLLGEALLDLGQPEACLAVAEGPRVPEAAAAELAARARAAMAVLQQPETPLDGAVHTHCCSSTRGYALCSLPPPPQTLVLISATTPRSALQ